MANFDHEVSQRALEADYTPAAQLQFYAKYDL
jgi:hypothetical protein